MKKLLTLIALTGVFASGALADVTVNWVNPEDYTDATSEHLGGDKDRKIVLDELERYINDMAKRFVPEGRNVVLNVTNVDLEGEFEPWRASTYNDVRIVKPIYPARITFSYEVRDASGEVVRQGEDKLMHNMLTRPFPYNDMYRYPYSREILADWFRDNFREDRKMASSK